MMISSWWKEYTKIDTKALKHATISLETKVS